MVAPGLRVVFFGTPAFAVPTLDALLRSRHTVLGVVTQPDRPRGRGQTISDAPVKARAIAAGLPILQPEKMKDEAFLQALGALDADLGVVAAYGKILTDAVLAIPRRGLINVHASLLPRYRGAAPVHRAIIAGDDETGVTIMRVVKALDAGPMLAVARCPIGPDDTSVTIEQQLAALGADLLVRVADEIAEGRAIETPQNEGAATYAHRLTRDDGRCDWGCPAARVHNLIRGLHPWPHAFTFFHGRRIILIDSSIDADTAMPDVAPGTIVDAAADRLAIATGRGVLRLTRLQAEGKRVMTAREFLAGHPMSTGDVLTTAP
jgi:methionyl-tRNA formyltransferase